MHSLLCRMGSGTSKQRLGERVIAAQKMLEAVKKDQAERTKRIEAASPEAFTVIVQSITDSFERCSPFSEPLLMVAFQANPEEVQRVITKSVKKVLSAPIDKCEFAWFKKHVFPSMVWMMQNKEGEFLYEAMMKITKSMSEKIDNSMHSIYDHLQTHKEWENMTTIKNQNVVTRQDDDRVGQLTDQGIRDMVEVKQEQDTDSGDVPTFIRSTCSPTRRRDGDEQVRRLQVGAHQARGKVPEQNGK